jgi:YVTN family beta-propeller protein
MLAAVVCGAAAFAQSPSVLRQVAAIRLPNVSGRIDHLAFDAARARLYVAALGNNTVEVVDTSTNRHLRSLAGFHEPQGLAVVSDVNGVAVANGESGTLQLIDEESLQVRWTTKIGGDADNVRYDALAKRIYIAAVGGLFAVDPSSGKLAGRIAIDGHPESFQLETQGSRVFANLPGDTRVIDADRRGMTVANRWDAPCGANYPMALDEAARRLFVGCRRPASLAVVDTASGKPVAAVPIVGDTDDLFYDSDRKRIYVIGGDGAVDVYDRSGDQLRRRERVQTRAGARTGLWVASLRNLYVAAPARSGQQAEVRVLQAEK